MVTVGAFIGPSLCDYPCTVRIGLENLWRGLPSIVTAMATPSSRGSSHLDEGVGCGFVKGLEILGEAVAGIGRPAMNGEKILFQAVAGF